MNWYAASDHACQAGLPLERPLVHDTFTAEGA